MPAFTESNVGIMSNSKVLANLTRWNGHGVRRRLPESSIGAQRGSSLRIIRDTSEVTKEAMTYTVSESWLEWVSVHTGT